MTTTMEAPGEVLAQLRATVKRLFAGRSSEADVRRTMESPEGYDDSLWQQMSGVGLPGLLIGEEYGGAGLGPRELGGVMEEAGAALYCGPLFSSAVLAAELLRHSDDEAARARLLPGIASGSTIATSALTGPSGSWTFDGVAVTAETGTAPTLSGTASYVTFGNIADIVLVVARSGAGIGLFEVDPSLPGVTVTPNKTVDLTLRLATLEFNRTPAQPIAISGWDAVERALDVARVALASEQAGAASRLFDMTVDYIKNRFQFGRAVGGFQALKHMAADLYIERESAISAARNAADALASGSPGAQEAINLAAFACKDSVSKIAFDAVQMHGGIAFTWEFPVHLYLRRARSTAQLLGAPDFYRERYLQILEA